MNISKMNNILLIGISGVYNLGCEAIVRGTVSILKSLNPHIKITYASYSYDTDVQSLSDCDLMILKRPKRKRWSIKNVTRKLLSFIGIDLIIDFDDISIVSGFDAVFSIGGDIYTLNRDGSYCKGLISFANKCIDKGIPYILWGCSVGPFEKNPLIKNIFAEHLKRVHLIVAREYATIKYLKTLGITKNICFAPDPAFFVPDPNNVCEKKTLPIQVVGINLSPLSGLHYYNSISDAISCQKSVIERLLSEHPNVSVMLIPHVFSPDLNDNDYFYLKEIKARISDRLKKRVMLIEPGYGFVQTKSFLRECDILISARMHCAINALTVGTPAIFLSYSEKSKGMAELVYNTSEGCCFSLHDFDKIAINDLDKVINLYDVDKINGIKKFDFRNVLNCLI